MPTAAKKMDKNPEMKKKKPITVSIVLVFDDIANLFDVAK